MYVREIKKQTEKIFRSPKYRQASHKQLIDAVCDEFDGEDIEVAVAHIDHLLENEGFLIPAR